MREKCLLGALLVVGGVILSVALFGEQGWREVKRLRQDRARLQRDVQDLREKRDQLSREVLGLKDNPRAIEERAREDLGMIKKGETVFLLPEHQAVDH